MPEIDTSTDIEPTSTEVQQPEEQRVGEPETTGAPVLVARTSDPDKFLVRVQIEGATPGDTVAKTVTKAELEAMGGRVPVEGAQAVVAGKDILPEPVKIEPKWTPGPELPKPPEDLIKTFAEEHGMSEQAAKDTVDRYKVNPKSDEFKPLSASEIMALNKAGNLAQDTNLVEVARRVGGGQFVTEKELSDVEQQLGIGAKELLIQEGVDTFTKTMQTQLDQSVKEAKSAIANAIDSVGNLDVVKAVKSGIKDVKVFMLAGFDVKEDDVTKAQEVIDNIGTMDKRFQDAFNIGGVEGFNEEVKRYNDEVKQDIINSANLLPDDAKVAVLENLNQRGIDAAVASYNQYVTANNELVKQQEISLAELRGYKEGEDYTVGSLARYLLDNPDKVDTLIHAGFDDNTINEVVEYSQQPYVKPNPNELYNQAVVKAGGKLTMSANEWGNFLSNHPEIRSIDTPQAWEVFMNDYAGKQLNPVSLAEFERQYLTARGIEESSTWERDNKAKIKAGVAKSEAERVYAQLYGTGELLKSTSAFMLASVVSPARVLYPEVTKEDITPLEWGTGAVQVALLALPGVGGVIGRVAGPVVARAVTTGILAGAAGLFTYDTVVNYKDMNTAERAFAIGMDTLLTAGAIAGIAGLKGFKARVKPTTERLAKIAEATKEEPKVGPKLKLGESQAYNEAYRSTKKTLGRIADLQSERGGGFTVTSGLSKAKVLQLRADGIKAIETEIKDMQSGATGKLKMTPEEISQYRAKRMADLDRYVELLDEQARIEQRLSTKITKLAEKMAKNVKTTTARAYSALQSERGTGFTVESGLSKSKVLKLRADGLKAIETEIQDIQKSGHLKMTADEVNKYRVNRIADLDRYIEILDKEAASLQGIPGAIKKLGQYAVKSKTASIKVLDNLKQGLKTINSQRGGAFEISKGLSKADILKLRANGIKAIESEIKDMAKSGHLSMTAEEISKYRANRIEDLDAWIKALDEEAMKGQGIQGLTSDFSRLVTTSRKGSIKTLKALQQGLKTINSQRGGGFKIPTGLSKSEVLRLRANGIKAIEDEIRGMQAGKGKLAMNETEVSQYRANRMADLDMQIDALDRIARSKQGIPGAIRQVGKLTTSLSSKTYKALRQTLVTLSSEEGKGFRIKQAGLTKAEILKLRADGLRAIESDIASMQKSGHLSLSGEELANYRQTSIKALDTWIDILDKRAVARQGIPGMIRRIDTTSKAIKTASKKTLTSIKESVKTVVISERGGGFKVDTGLSKLEILRLRTNGIKAIESEIRAMQKGKGMLRMTDDEVMQYRQGRMADLDRYVELLDEQARIEKALSTKIKEPLQNVKDRLRGIRDATDEYRRVRKTMAGGLQAIFNDVAIAIAKNDVKLLKEAAKRLELLGRSIPKQLGGNVIVRRALLMAAKPEDYIKLAKKDKLTPEQLKSANEGIKANEKFVEDAERVLRKIRDPARRKVIEEQIKQAKRQVKIAVKEKTAVMYPLVKPIVEGKYLPARIEEAKKSLAKSNDTIPVKTPDKTSPVPIPAREFAHQRLSRIAEQYHVAERDIINAVSASRIGSKTLIIVANPDIKRAFSTINIFEPTNATKPIQEPGIKTARVTETIPELQVLPEVATETQNKVKTVTKTETITETKPKTEIVPVPIPIIKTRTRVKTKEPKRIIKLPLPTAAEERETIIGDGVGKIAWYQGKLKLKGKLREQWYVVSPPFKTIKDIRRQWFRPRGATIVEGVGAAYATIQSLGYPPPSFFMDIDWGAFDLALSKPTKMGDKGAMRFTRDIKQRTRKPINVKDIQTVVAM